MLDSNPGGQAAAAVSPVRPQRPDKAPAPLLEKVKVGQIFRMNPFQGQDRKIKTPKMVVMGDQVGKLGMLIRIQTAAAERSRPQALEFRHGKTQLRGPARRPERLRECQPAEQVAAARQEKS